MMAELPYSVTVSVSYCQELARLLGRGFSRITFNLKQGTITTWRWYIHTIGCLWRRHLFRNAECRCRLFDLKRLEGSKFFESYIESAFLIHEIV